MKTCHLCLKDKELADSHLIPKFVFRWMKQTGSGFMRKGENLNIRTQDGIKTPFLCHECEARLNKYETYFANKIFFPVVNAEVIQFEYSENLHRFAISVFWRLLKYSILEEERSVSYHSDLVHLEDHWRNYLLNDEIVYESGLHLLIGVDVVEVQSDQPISVTPRIIQYMGRAVDAGITDSDTKAMLFLKLPRFLFIYQIHGFNNVEFLNTEILSSGGSYLLNNAKIADTDVGNFILDRANMIDEMFANMSNHQKEKLKAFTNEKWIEVSNKDLGRITKYQHNRYKG